MNQVSRWSNEAQYPDSETENDLIAEVMSLVTEAETKGMIKMVSSANCILQADEPAIDEIWFDWEQPNGDVLPMRQDTILAALKETHEETPKRKYNHKNKGVGTTHFDGDDCDPLGHPKGFYS